MRGRGTAGPLQDRGSGDSHGTGKSYEAEAELTTKNPRYHVSTVDQDEEASANAGRRC